MVTNTPSTRNILRLSFVLFLLGIAAVLHPLSLDTDGENSANGGGRAAASAVKVLAGNNGGC